MNNIIRLYLYTTTKGLISILRDKYIRISLPWKTNDYTEGVAQGETSRSEKVKEYGYICLSKTCNSPSMWGYYAEGSRGACLVFDINKNEYRKLSRCLRFEAVTYQDERASKNATEEDKLFIKSKEWAHEQEYRILFNLSRRNSITVNETAIFPEKVLFRYLRGVILGAACEKEKIEIIPLLPSKKQEVTKMLFDPLLFCFCEHQRISENDDWDDLLNRRREAPNLMDD